MMLNNTPTNKAVLSNVAQVNSFAIKATANSFQILSSGLYANKIKAIIRELSCNAFVSSVQDDINEESYSGYSQEQYEDYYCYTTH